MIRETPNFTYQQDLACPKCGGMLEKRYMLDRHGRHKRIYGITKRPEKDGPWASDDVLEDVTESVSKYEKRKCGRVWVHKAEFQCSKCGCVMSRGNAVPHEFADDELPWDFYQTPEGEYLPEPGETKPETEMPAPDPDDVYGLAGLF